MSATWELKEHSTGELTSTVSGDVWKQAQEKAFKKIAKSVTIPGFRKGKVPENLLRKQIGTEQVLYEAVDVIAQSVLEDGIKEHALELVDRPSLNVKSINKEEVTLAFDITVKPDVALGEYKNLDVKKEAVTVSDDDVMNVIKSIQDSKAEFMIKEEDATVENGDTAVIDFEGFKDGVAFDNGSGTSYPLEIGSGAFIPGFEEQLIGMKAGETKDINLTFPKEYQAEELAGQDVVFKVTVHEIKVKELPDFTDEMVKELKIEDVETVGAYKDYTLKQLTEEKERQVEDKFVDQLLETVVHNAQMDIPPVMLESEIDESVQVFSNRIAQQGFDLDTYLKLSNMRMDDLRAQFANEADSKVRVRLVLEKIADVEHLETTNEEIETEYTKMAEQYKMEESLLKNLLANDMVAYDLRLRKALDLIKETAGK